MEMLWCKATYTSFVSMSLSLLALQQDTIISSSEHSLSICGKTKWGFYHQGDALELKSKMISF